jgi:hypothetical protein
MSPAEYANTDFGKLDLSKPADSRIAAMLALKQAELDGQSKHTGPTRADFGPTDYGKIPTRNKSCPS